MTTALTIHCPVPFARRPDVSTAVTRSVSQGGGRLPRVTRLMALALRLEAQVRRGEFPDYNAIATVGQVSRSRVSQILNLGLLAPDIQEDILFLSPVPQGRDPIHIALLQPIAALADWAKQRRRWQALRRQTGIGRPQQQ